MFEGLPVRHWRKSHVTVNVAPQKDNNATIGQSSQWPELPMPKDAHLLSPMSQALLRAARMGQVNKPPPPQIEEDKDLGEEEDADADMESTFAVRRWALVPRHLEGAEPEYLAKRRKGLPSVYGGTVMPPGGTAQMRKTKVRKTDTDGNTAVWDVLVPEGQTVEGEIFEGESFSTQAAPAPGTIVEGVGVVNAEGLVIAGDQMSTPARRRPPPPKRKAKGPGRGRRKRVGFVSISNPGGVHSRRGGHGAPIGLRPIDGDSLKPGLVSDQGTPQNADIEMGEDSVLQDGEEAGEDGSDDEEEGEDGDDNDREEGELSPSPSVANLNPTKFSKSPIPNLLAERGMTHDPVPELTLTVPQLPIDREPSSSPDLPLAAGQAFHVGAPLIKIDPAQEAIPTPAPAGPDDIPVSRHILVEAAPPPQAFSANAELPADHGPLDGLVEPTVPSPKPAEPDPETELGLFPDVEEDLLGSLERSLDRADGAG